MMADMLKSNDDSPDMYNNLKSLPNQKFTKWTDRNNG